MGAQSSASCSRCFPFMDRTCSHGCTVVRHGILTTYLSSVDNEVCGNRGIEHLGTVGHLLTDD